MQKITDTRKLKGEVVEYMGVGGSISIVLYFQDCNILVFLNVKCILNGGNDNHHYL